MKFPEEAEYWDETADGDPIFQNGKIPPPRPQEYVPIYNTNAKSAIEDYNENGGTPEALQCLKAEAKYAVLKARVDAEALKQSAQGRKQLSLWADPAMKSAVPQPTGPDGRVRPTVRILQATPDPLGTLAAIMAIYKGGVKRSLAEVTDAERREALAEMLKTKLQGPLEAITFTILIEGVSRSFTHQMVRGRAAFYAQESMRFAVPDQEDWNDRVARPAGWESWREDARHAWEESVETAEACYSYLVGAGVPAEDARGLMPHAMTTRLVWQVSLRELLHVAGLRLCTQAQFEWRTVLSLVVSQLRRWGVASDIKPHDINDSTVAWEGWQFLEIADLLRPVCFQEGKCGFKSNFDRSCKIRDRVDAHEAKGEHPSTWDDIRPEEWLASPDAAR